MAPLAFDAEHRRIRIGDLATTTRGCGFGPGIVGEVVKLTSKDVSLTTTLTEHRLVTVRHRHVLILEFRSGFRGLIRKRAKKPRQKT